LDKSNETVAKYLQKYQQFASDLSLEKKIELISDLVKYQEHYTKVYKFQSQQRKPMSKKQKREYYMAVIKSYLGWRFKDFKDLLRQLKREDLNQLWALVKEYLTIRPASNDKEMELWVELKRMYEPDPEDQLWTLTQNYMHAPVEWKLYNLSGLHHVTAKDKEIFMLVEKDYPLRRGLALVMISYRLQVENHSQMAEDLLKKIYNITNPLRKQRESSHWQYKFPLPVEGVPTARRMEIPLPRVCTAMMKKLPLQTMIDQGVTATLAARDALRSTNGNDSHNSRTGTESYAEQAFWSQYSVQTNEPIHSGTTIVKVSNELPKVSMVNSCLKKLKFHLASFDIVVKERTTATAITEGMCGFEHTKACFRDDIIPFVKNLKELFTSFDQCLNDEVTEVQKIFKQIELAVEQHCAKKTKFQTKMENVLKENDRLLTQALSVEIVNIVVHDYVNFDGLNMDACVYCVTTESELKPDFIKKECYEIDNVSSSESAPSFAELFEINELKAQIQEKDTVIWKLKEKLKSSSGDVKERKVERDIEELKTLNLELDHKVTKLAAKNNHLKQTYKQLFDSIKSSRVQSKEQCDDLINKVNLKSVEVADLNASLQEKFLVITALKDKLKGKAVLTKVVSLNPIDPALLQVDVVPLVPKLRKNRTAHIDYIRHTQEEAATLRELVESERLLNNGSEPSGIGSLLPPQH
nr:hypothetical protein [Tanacetum cinerariifolium]